MVRVAEDKDFDFVKNSWAVCFDDPDEFVNWNFEYNYISENTIIAECDKKAASVMQLIPYEMNLCGESIDVRYVSGVATLPQYRGRGLVRELFDFGIPYMEKLGCDISILIPAVDGMYEKFGYRKICERTIYEAECIEGFAEYREVSGKLIDIVSKIYDTDMQNKKMYIKRSKENFKKILTDLIELSKGCVYVAEEDGKETGYAFAYPKNNKYEVCEICGNMNFEVKPVEVPPIMARIINAEAVAKKLSVELPHADAGDLTQMLFEKPEINKSSYINMLL